MLTPQEVAEHAFQKASFGGYNMAMVDEFLDLLTADYTTLYKENAALKAKMKVLADKIEEYRSTEDAMRKALLSAQRVADQMVAEAQEQRDKLLADADRQIQERLSSIRQEVENEQLRLSAAQNSTAVYISKLKALHEHEIQYLGSLGKLTATPAEPDPVAQTATAINDAVEKAIEEEFPAEPETDVEGDSLYQELLQGPAHAETAAQAEIPQVPAPTPVEPTPAPQEDVEDTKPTRRIDFGPLKFGKDYRGEG